jgi:NAD dependent epimerase/dehydratase family enzyme
LGLGGPVGNGRQYLSWIALDDLLGVLLESILNDGLDGPVNAVAPGVVTNREFAKTLGRVLHRPAVLPAPAAALRLALGGLAQELLLASQRVLPAQLDAAGFRFAFPTMESALRHALGRSAERTAAHTADLFHGATSLSSKPIAARSLHD